MERVRIGIAIVLLSVASACGSSGATGQANSTPTATGVSQIPATPSPTPLPSPTPSPSVALPTPSVQASPVTPTLSCSSTPVAASEPLVIVRATDFKSTLIDSFANPTHPVTLCSLSGNAYDVRFISRTEIGYAINSSSNDPINGILEIQRMSLIDRRPITVVTQQGDALDVAWSPDGSSVAYLLYTEDANLGSGAGNQLWLKTGSAAPRPISPLIPLFGRDGSVNDQTIVRFSHDGKYVLMVDTFVTGVAPELPKLAAFQVLSAEDGSLVWVPPSALGVSGGKSGPFITMAAWSHLSDRLYYRDQAGVHTWDAPATVGMLAQGLAWLSPSVSPDDRLVAYSVVVGGLPQIQMRDLAVAGSVRVLPGALGDPIMLSNQEMFEAHFVRSNQYGPPYVGTGNYVLNLLTKVETELPGIFPPIDVWPH
jgi:hypothetical protein